MGQLKQLFPDAFSEGKIDFDVLKQLLGSDVDDSEERYGLNWHGKRQARSIALTPSRGTLRPCQEDSVNWDSTQNLMIEGDNLEVLKLLQKSYSGKVKLIYIDPPYNTGKDFVYRDNFHDNIKNYLELTGQADGDIKLSTNTETSGRYHANWLSMMYPRLILARNLLRDDGVIFISIDEVEQANLRKLCDEIFGEDNFIECISWNKRIPQNDKGIGNIHEYVFLYVKNSTLKHEFLMRKDGLEDIYTLIGKLKKNKTPLLQAQKEVSGLYKKNGYDRGITLYNNLDFDYRLWGKINMSWPNANTFGPDYDVLHPKTKNKVKVPDRGWRWKKETFDEAAGIVNGEYTKITELADGSFICGKIWFSHKDDMQPSSITYLDDVNDFLLRSILSIKSDGGIEVEELFGVKGAFSYPKPTTLINTLINSVRMEDDDIVLDFFSGSGTTGHSIIDNNQDKTKKNRFILVQLPEVLSPSNKEQKIASDLCDDIKKPRLISELTKERLRRAGAKISADNPDWQGDTGFRVFKLDTSNIRPWLADAASLDAQMQASLSPLLEDRSQDDVMTELLLKRGIDLSVRLEVRDFDGLRVTCAGNGMLFTCLESHIPASSIEALASGLTTWHRELGGSADAVCYFIDEAFENNVAKSNLCATLVQQGLNQLHSL